MFHAVDGFADEEPTRVDAVGGGGDVTEGGSGDGWARAVAGGSAEDAMPGEGAVEAAARDQNAAAAAHAHAKVADARALEEAKRELEDAPHQGARREADDLKKQIELKDEYIKRVSAHEREARERLRQDRLRGPLVRDGLLEVLVLDLPVLGGGPLHHLGLHPGGRGGPVVVITSPSSPRRE